MPGLCNRGGMWPVATVTAPGHINDHSLPDPQCHTLLQGDSGLPVSESVRCLVVRERSEGAYRNHAVSCPRGTTAAG